MKGLLAGVAALWLAAQPAAADAAAVAIRLANATAAPLRCQFLLAHWMTSAPLTLAPGEELRLTLGRADDGALFLSQPGEARPFTVEALVCGPETGFWEGRRQIDLSALVERQALEIAVVCRPDRPLACRAER